MREIRFRAWSIKERKFINDFLLGCSGDELGLFSHRSNEWSFEDVDSNYILMQSTGLKDKNGKEIYEGDILEWDGVDHKTRWDDDGGFIEESVPTKKRGVVQWLGACQGYSNTTHHSGQGYRAEVIGNIYENPELAPAGERP